MEAEFIGPTTLLPPAGIRPLMIDLENTAAFPMIHLQGTTEAHLQEQEAQHAMQAYIRTALCTEVLEQLREHGTDWALSGQQFMAWMEAAGQGILAAVVNEGHADTPFLRDWVRTEVRNMYSFFIAEYIGTLPDEKQRQDLFDRYFSPDVFKQMLATNIAQAPPEYAHSAPLDNALMGYLDAHCKRYWKHKPQPAPTYYDKVLERQMEVTWGAIRDCAWDAAVAEPQLAPIIAAIGADPDSAVNQQLTRQLDQLLHQWITGWLSQMGAAHHINPADYHQPSRQRGKG